MKNGINWWWVLKYVLIWLLVFAVVFWLVTALLNLYFGPGLL